MSRRAVRSLPARVLPWLALAVALEATGAAAQPLAFAACRDARGRPVATQQRLGLGRVAATERDAAGRPLLVYDPLVLAWLTPATRLWLHTHECAHLALGHDADGSLAQEREADCWAARTLVAAGQLHPTHLATIQGDLAGLGAADWRSLAGPRRDVPLRACLDEARRPRAAGG
jgi:hypothetical protein